MRIAFVTSAFPWGSGEVFLRPEFVRLAEHGVEAVAIPMRPYGDQTVALEPGQALVRPLFDLRILAGAARTACRHPVGTARAIGTVFGGRDRSVLLRNLAVLPKALWLADLARRRGFDHLHAHWAGPPSTAAMIASDISGVSWSLTAHFADIAAGNLLRRKFATARFTRFISLEMMRLARRTAPGGDESRWVMLHLGVDVPGAWEEPPPPGDRAIILMAARFDPEKRHSVALRALRTLVDQGRAVELWIAGRGPLEGVIRSEVARLHLEAEVQMLGYQPNARLLELLWTHQVDIVALPSDGEGIPVSLMEALAAGVPTVACDAGGVGELLGDGCGVLVDVDDVGGFTTGLARLLDDDELRRGVARRGRARVEREFSTDATTSSFVDLLRSA